MITTYIEAPEILYIDDNAKAIFLAGGITGCRNWQEEAAEFLLKNSYFDYIFNPRRKHFDINNESQTEIQIKWEYSSLFSCSHIMFWFTADTVQPITLFELGKWAHTYMDKKIYVGCDPQYSRIFDVKTQLSLSRPDIKIWDSLGSMLEFIAADSR